MLKLTTYKRGQFPNLKKKLEADGYTYASAMELRNTQKLASLCSEGPVALDVSPLLPLLDPTSRLNGTASVTEMLMHLLPGDTQACRWARQQVVNTTCARCSTKSRNPKSKESPPRKQCGSSAGQSSS